MNILLVEPGYKTKYPPLGLMKLSTYHRKIKNDDVTFIKGCSSQVRDYYWDKVYITTLFTYNWEETIKTINYYQETLFNFSRKIYVGGILATLMPDDLRDATGIEPVIGLLNDPYKIDQDDEVNIDELPPDYEILQQLSNVKYSHLDSYISYTTRGCIRKCEFCAVNALEPNYVPYIDIKNAIDKVIKTYSFERQNLLLMDNNVLASKYFDIIIDDIKAAGFKKGGLTFGKTRRKRIVDFNQGLDARLLTDDKMKRLAEINLDPLRIAFDDIKWKKAYIKAVRIAHKYGQINMSNYILYNYKDKPEDFYERLKINIELNEEFKNDYESNNNTSITKTKIYSFPMRYIPIDAKDRHVDTGNRYWNKRYLRGLQVILNVMKGPVMVAKEFYEQAFGSNPEEFKSILLMPDEFIRKRLISNWKTIKDKHARNKPYVKKWMEIYGELTIPEKNSLVEILSGNDKAAVKKYYDQNINKRINNLLDLHLRAVDITK